MCGPSAQEESAQAQQASLATQLQNNFAERFASQSGTLAQLNTELGQLSRGETPQGFGTAELAAMNAQAINTNAAATRNAQQAAGSYFAGQGGGAASALPSGVQEAVRGGIAATGATNLANTQNQITLENYNVGRENLIRSIGGLSTLAGLQNPTPYAGEATNALGSSFGMAKDINQQKNQWQADVAGAVTGIAKAGLGIATGGLSTLAGAGLSGISNAAEGGIADTAASNYSDWTTSLGAPAGWVPGQE